MANNNLKTFMCFFSNGMCSVMGADSKEDALKAVKAMEMTANAKLINIEQIDILPEHFGYLTPEQPQLNDGNEPDEDIDMGF